MFLLASFHSLEKDVVVGYVVGLAYYIRQVNGVKLAVILFSLMRVCVCVPVRPPVCAHSVFRCKYLENGLR